MAEKDHSKFTVPGFAASEGKPCKKRKTLHEKAMHKKYLDQQRNQTRVNIGVAFQRWRELRDLKGLKSDSSMAVFLLDSYEKHISTSTPLKSEFTRPPSPVSTIVLESPSDRYEKDLSTSSPLKSEFTRPPSPVSTIVSESLSDRYERDLSTSSPSKDGFTKPPPPVSESLSDRDDDDFPSDDASSDDTPSSPLSVILSHRTRGPNPLKDAYIHAKLRKDKDIIFR